MDENIIAFYKLLATKRSGIAIGEQRSDDGVFMIDVRETLADICPNSDARTLILHRVNDNCIFINKELFDKSELAVFFYLVFAHIRRYYPNNTIGCDAAAFQQLCDAYPAAPRKAFSLMYDDYNKVLTSYLTEDNENSKFASFILDRSVKMSELVSSKIAEI